MHTAQYSRSGLSLDLCIPVYNEADIILQTITTLTETLSRTGVRDWSLIVADNGSTDGTAAVVERARVPNVSVLRVSGKGKGRAIRESAAVSHRDVFGFIDVDLSAAPEHIADFVRYIEEGHDVVIGSRLHPDSATDRGWWRTSTSRGFNVLARLLTGVQVMDVQCGLKLMNGTARDLLSVATQDTWFLDLELLMLSARHELRVIEVPISWKEYQYGDRKSKLRILPDTVNAVRAMVYLRNRYK